MQGFLRSETFGTFEQIRFPKLSFRNPSRSGIHGFSFPFRFRSLHPSIRYVSHLGTSKFSGAAHLHLHIVQSRIRGRPTDCRWQNPHCASIIRGRHPGQLFGTRAVDYIVSQFMFPAFRDFRTYFPQFGLAPVRQPRVRALHGSGFRERSSPRLPSLQWRLFRYSNLSGIRKDLETPAVGLAPRLWWYVTSYPMSFPNSSVHTEHGNKVA